MLTNDQILCKPPTRSSNELLAKVNGVLMDTNVSSALLKTPSSEYITQEWVVVGEQREQVSWAGDSGGLFLDEDNNRVAGMIIGGVTNKEMFDIRYDNITLITPAQKLVEWIKDDFGMEISFCVGG